MGHTAVKKRAKVAKKAAGSSTRKRRKDSSSESDSDSSSSSESSSPSSTDNSEVDSDSSSNSESSSDSSSSSSSDSSSSSSSSSKSSASSSSDSDSSSSEDSSSSSSEDSGSSSSEDSSSSSSEDSDSDSDIGENSGLPKGLQYLEENQKQAQDNIQRLKSGLEGYVATNIDMVQAQHHQEQSEIDERIKSRFKEIYMEYATTAFGSDLDTIRKEEDIDDEGLEMLVDALESGVQSFTNSEQKMIVDGTT
ncbi:hypothetical protein COEREDRAFT_79607 [Coemansia reversa NRRL 1564]|uniref:Ribosome-assembly protein 3 C-terminal domain-containing protein n=1 Tax=Coemansia reversa (strain ATCC 12441 / NRRL 1564) TaxID=763665 RepID=A0A2G5BHR4_COERN|nr:hypothetical protein COEREDRAFT_79607 [Coemansia reversa NRRL 1564]|eukprot:PIA18560.1 hypothetical protein COEREDRAFT_79607 [Coemansia reversa NRRL 1564]